MKSTSFMDVSQATDLATFERNLVNAAANLGFPLANCILTHLGPLPGHPLAVYSVGNMPEAYTSFADLELTLRDPFMARLREQKFQAITYDQGLYVKANAAELWEEQASFGYRYGIAASLDLPDHRRFVFGMDGDRPLPRDTEAVMLEANLLLLAVHAQAAATRLLPHKPKAGRPPAAAQKPSLSARELECLKWTRDSKTAWEVGVILGISERTVNAHISNAMRKLHCFNKHQAVLKAIDLGLLN
jgi:LuxR family transcriptional regulator